MANAIRGRLRVEQDFEGEGLWDAVGRPMRIGEGRAGRALGRGLRAALGADGAQALIEALRRWSREWPGMAVAAEALAAYSREGLALARRLKAALPDWSVLYADDARLRRVASGERCGAWEYEVALARNAAPPGTHTHGAAPAVGPRRSG
jgi:hypothetical protein